MKYPNVDRSTDIYAASLHNLAVCLADRANITAHHDRLMPLLDMCMAYSKAEKHKFKSARRKVTSELSEELGELRLDALPYLFEHSGNTTAVTAHYEQFHISVVDAMRTALRRVRRYNRKSNPTPEHKGNINRDVGRIAELAVMAMISRYSDPALVVQPALPYQDMGELEAHNNFDICVASPEAAHRIQVKARCFGLCSEDGPRVKTTVKESKNYSTAIQLVSACCHAGVRLGSNHDIGQSNARLLITETGGLSAEAVRRLDHTTNYLEYCINYDALPRGTLTIEGTA